MRTYTLVLGSLEPYLRLYGERGLAVQKRVLGHLVGHYVVEVGELNKVIHMWGYSTFEDRARRREALWEDSEWLEYVKVAKGLVIKQENQLLRPSPFFEVPTGT